jgi:hypothetical protein
MLADTAPGTAPMRFNSLRLNLARTLVLAAFVWPFLNFSCVFPDSHMEIDFLPAFLAMALFPEALFEDSASLLLLGACLALVAVWGTLDAALRLLAGVLPCVFLIALYRRCREAGRQLISHGVALVSLSVFTAFCFLQYIHLHLFRILPDALTDGLTLLIPRYMDEPYDALGTRGVQGWASEPSSAAMTCFSFAVVALCQQPRRRWLVLLLFSLLAALNKSVYAMLFLALLVLACLARLRKKGYALLGAISFLAGFAAFVLASGRVAEMRENFLIFGLAGDMNKELQRLGQIAGPLLAFPRMYKPGILFDSVMQPLGLLPLLAGFGSVFGLLLYVRIAFCRLLLANAEWPLLGVAVLAVFSLLASPDFIPMAVALAYAFTPHPAPTLPALRPRWFVRFRALLHQAAAAPAE